METIGRRASRGYGSLGDTEETLSNSRRLRGHRQAIFAVMVALAFALLILGSRAAYPTVPTGLSHSPIVTTDADGALTLTASEYPWTLAPEDEHITILRATFDKGGYQLRTAAGNLIVVPFTQSSVFPMKFALTEDGGTYFVNSGNAPVLYLPATGYLENATLRSARWYPFSKEFRPEIPVYAAMAPSLAGYTSMAWYSGMKCSGSFWTDLAFAPTGLVIPAIGLSYTVGQQRMEGWARFREWSLAHPSPYRIAYADAGLYRRIGQTHRLFAHRRAR